MRQQGPGRKPQHRAVTSLGKVHLCSVEEALALPSSMQVFLLFTGAGETLTHLSHPDSASSGESPCGFGPESLVDINESSGQEVLEPGTARSAQLAWGKTCNAALQCGSSKHPLGIKMLLS